VDEARASSATRCALALAAAPLLVCAAFSAAPENLPIVLFVTETACLFLAPAFFPRLNPYAAFVVVLPLSPALVLAAQATSIASVAAAQVLLSIAGFFFLRAGRSLSRRFPAAFWTCVLSAALAAPLASRLLISFDKAVRIELVSPFTWPIEALAGRFPAPVIACAALAVLSLLLERIDRGAPADIPA